MPEDRLDGWKEIAAYLEVAERTAQRMEGIGLPVRRLHVPMAGRDKQRVYAYRSELDAWLQAGGNRAATASPAPDADGADRPDGTTIDPVSAFPVPPAAVPAAYSHRKRAGLYAAAALAVVGIGVAVALVRKATKPNPVVAAQTRNHTFVVLGSDGQTLWTRQYKGFLWGPRDRAWSIVDLEGDGRNEVLVVEPGDTADLHVRALQCYEADGAPRWRYRAGRSLRWGAVDYPDRFLITGILHGRARDGTRYTALVANHTPDFPSCLVTLDPRGRVIGEYWHTGWIFDFAIADLDGDGVDEIVAGGINNLRRRPFIAALSYDISSAISPVAADFAPGLVAGRERTYALLPQSDVAAAMSVDSRISQLDFSETDGLIASVQLVQDRDPLERVYYLDKRLRPSRVICPQTFVAAHQQLRHERRIDHDFKESETEAFLKFEVLPSPRGAPPERR